MTRRTCYVSWPDPQALRSAQTGDPNLAEKQAKTAAAQSAAAEKEAVAKAARASKAAATAEQNAVDAAAAAEKARTTASVRSPHH